MFTLKITAITSNSFSIYTARPNLSTTLTYLSPRNKTPSHRKTQTNLPDFRWNRPLSSVYVYIFLKESLITSILFKFVFNLALLFTIHRSLPVWFWHFTPERYTTNRTVRKSLKSYSLPTLEYFRVKDEICKFVSCHYFMACFWVSWGDFAR